MLILFEGRDDDLYSTSSIIVMEQLNLNDEVGFFSFIWDSLIFLFSGAFLFMFSTYYIQISRCEYCITHSF